MPNGIDRFSCSLHRFDVIQQQITEFSEERDCEREKGNKFNAFLKCVHVLPEYQDEECEKITHTQKC